MGAEDGIQWGVTASIVIYTALGPERIITMWSGMRDVFQRYVWDPLLKRFS
jgi:ABC-type taurine transport system substrate-binding protein